MKFESVQWSGGAKFVDDPRRERIATAALAGMLADSSGHASIASYVADAVAFADALIAELDKPRTINVKPQEAKP